MVGGVLLVNASGAREHRAIVENIEARRIDVLFVYGTLMRGGAQHALVAGARAIEPARTRGRLYDLGRGYPVLIPLDAEDAAAGPWVEGEALSFDDLSVRFPALDAYEGYESEAPETSLYIRTIRPVSILGGPGAGRALDAWAYVMRREREAQIVRDGGRLLPNGRWRC